MSTYLMHFSKHASKNNNYGAQSLLAEVKVCNEEMCQ